MQAGASDYDALRPQGSSHGQVKRDANCTHPTGHELPISFAAVVFV